MTHLGLCGNSGVLDHIVSNSLEQLIVLMNLNFTSNSSILNGQSVTLYCEFISRYLFNGFGISNDNY